MADIGHGNFFALKHVPKACSTVGTDEGIRQQSLQKQGPRAKRYEVRVVPWSHGFNHCLAGSCAGTCAKQRRTNSFAAPRERCSISSSVWDSVLARACATLGSVRFAVQAKTKDGARPGQPRQDLEPTHTCQDFEKNSKELPVWRQASQASLCSSTGDTEHQRAGGLHTSSTERERGWGELARGGRGQLLSPQP